MEMIMMIRLNCVDSFPEVMKKTVFDNLSLVKAYDATFDPSKSFEDNIQCFDSQLLSYSQDGVCAIAEQLISAAGKCWIEGFHITRLVSPNEILEHGIQILDWESYRARIESVLSTYTCLSYIEKECVLARIFEYYRDKGIGRYKHLSFFAPASNYVLYEYLNEGFAHLYGQSIGGELLNCSLRYYKEYCPLIETLSNIGNKYLIRFQFQMQDLFRDCCDWDYTLFAHTLAFAVLYYRDYKSLPYDCFFASHLRQPVPSQNILSIDSLPLEMDASY